MTDARTLDRVSQRGEERTMARTYYTAQGDLHDYQTGYYLRPATEAEIAASDRAAERDGGRGVISEDDLSAPVPVEAVREHDAN